MSVTDLLKDKVTLVKPDGTVVKSEIPAAITAGQITIFDTDLSIEVGDCLQRTLPSGGLEEYVVIDPGYSSGLGSIKPHYQVKVRRSVAPVTP